MVIAFTADGDTTSSSGAGVRRLCVVYPGSVGRKLHFRKLPLVHHGESLLRMVGGMERGHSWLAEGDDHDHDDAERCEQHRHHQPTAAVAASVAEYRHNNRDSVRAGKGTFAKFEVS